MLLTDSRIRSEKPGNKARKLRDGRGLYLVVLPTGRKVWRIRYRKPDGKDTYFTFGEYCQSPAGETQEDANARRDSTRFTLSEARLEREKLRGLVKQGIHLSRHKKAQRAAKAVENANTFEMIAREWIRKQYWSPKYLKLVTNSLERDVFPGVGVLPIREITAPQLLEIFQKAENRGAISIAMLERQWTSAIFRYAVSTLRAETDPTTALRGSLTGRKVKHHKPLDNSDIPKFLVALDSYGGYRTTVIALRLLLLTFVRPGELRQAEWAEFNLDEAKWRIPAARMKMKERHIVPLSDQAVELLRELKMLTGNQQWLFPNYRRPRACMTETTLNRALERMGYNGKGTMGFSAHGFRATASTMLNEMGYRPDVIERQLAHKERNQSRASYNRAEYLEERQNLMQKWANYLDGIAAGAEVLPFRGGSSMP